MLCAHTMHFNPAHWRVDPETGVPQHVDGHDLDGPHPIAFEVTGPVMPFNKVRVRLAPNPLACGGVPRTLLPDALPMVAVRLVDRNGVVVAAPISGQDSGAPNGWDAQSYSQPHNVELVPSDPLVALPIVVDRDIHRVMVFIEGEYGPGSMGGMRVLSVELVE